MSETEKAAKKKMTGTRAKQKRMGSIAMLSALFGILGGHVPRSSGVSGTPWRPALVGRAKREAFRKQHPEIVEARINKVRARLERKENARYERHMKSEANSYKLPWQPKPSSLEKFKWPRDYRGQLIKPRWADQRAYQQDWQRVVASQGGAA